MAGRVEVTIDADGRVAVTELDRISETAEEMARRTRTSAQDTEDAFDSAARGTGRLGAALDTAQGGLGQFGDSFDAVGQSASAMQDIMQHSERKASELARAQTDVEQAANDAAQAIEDMNQANRDSAQAGIDAEQAAIDQQQALIDEKAALDAYNEAVKKHGADSEEALQAQNDIKQARLDGKQATEDAAQAERDAAQALLDGKQAATDLKTANLDAADANRQLEESGSALTTVAEWGGMLSGVVGGLTGVLGIVTIAQWAWNASLLANPITWIVLLIGGLIAAIVLIATKTKWFQTIWKNVWGWAKDFVSDQFGKVKTTVTNVIGVILTVVRALPGKIKTALRSLAGFLAAPFKAAFNAIAGAWNNTVGRLAFTIPGWVPGIGGSSFSMPKIPQFAIGGDVLRTGLAVIHAGERIVPTARAQRLDMASAGRAADFSNMQLRTVFEFKPSGNDPWEDIIIDYIRNNVRVRAEIDNGIRKTVLNKGGSVQTTYGKRGVS